MTQVVPDKPLRVVVWSTGTIGRHAIAGIDAHPDLELVGVWVSNPAKEGKDAGILADLGRELGIRATTRPGRADRPGARRDRAHGDGRRPGLRVHRGPDLVRRGRHQRHEQRSGPAAVAGGDPAAGVHRPDRGGLRQGQGVDARQRHRPRVRQRHPAAGDDQPQPAHRRGPGHGDLRLLDVLPAGRDGRPVRLRSVDGRGAVPLAARHPDHGLGQRRPADRGRSRRHPRRAADREGRTTRGHPRHRVRVGGRQGGDDGLGPLRADRRGRRRRRGSSSSTSPAPTPSPTPTGRGRPPVTTAATGSGSLASR